MKTKATPAQVRRKIADQAGVIHELEMTLGNYEGRKCDDRPATERALSSARVKLRELKDELDDAIAAEKRFLKKR